MEKIKIQSKEKHFLDYLQKMGTMYGTFGRRTYFDEVKKRLIDEDIKFLVVNPNLKVIFRHKPYIKGNYHPTVQKKVDSIKSGWPKIENNDEEMHYECERQRTDGNIEELICHLQTSSALDWCSFQYIERTPAEEAALAAETDLDKVIEMSFRRRSDEDFDIEPSSEEFEYFEFVTDCYEYCIKPHSQSTFENRDIEYEGYTEKGKKAIDKCIEWYKHNTSKTPVQDAWMKVLEKNGIKTHKPFDMWLQVPIMKKVDYSTKEELEIKRKAKDEAFKKSLSPETKDELRAIAERMKNK